MGTRFDTRGYVRRAVSEARQRVRSYEHERVHERVQERCEKEIFNFLCFYYLLMKNEGGKENGRRILF